MQILRNNNARLTSALQESNTNVEEWKVQLATYKDENSQLKAKVVVIHGVSKCTSFDMVPGVVKIIRSNFDDIWQKCSKYTRIEFVCFSSCVVLLFINFSSFKYNANFENYTSYCLSTWPHSVKKTKFYQKSV